MKRLLGLFLSLALLTALLAGCAKAPADHKPNAPGTTSAANAQQAAWPRTLTDAAGNKVVLQKQPQRIAILHSLYLEYFFALETPPVASMGASKGNAMTALTEWQTLKPYAGTADIIDLGSARDLNLEAVLAANPDVIVTFKGQGHLAQIYDQLIQIAPVIQIDFNAAWQDQTLACAEIVGKEALARDFIKETEIIIASAKDKLRKHNDKTIALFRTDGKSFISRGTQEYYETFGIAKPPGYPDDYQTLSLEAVAEMNPDYIIFQDSTQAAQTFVKAQESSSVWQSLTAVNSGQVLFFDDSLNTFGPLALRVTAGELLRVFSEQS
ncbi:ABC transporter substrate-binding protein|uniref:Iron complex transport system substrate-binding protein n=1 Tax=Dendrosporobacter quercicolus TaxID=146817 RepID=A0A1G9TU55_9FIRM|nr:ABC transporter substrate-binding protein [Dendrosporobacter quercicolus]NSL48854.1 ABC transporter substrate-binding protein [Dendrosporobacter quercicolus DSM 1736]SDM51088.1 iron complex transport system substrate-binding protein [Dendrosporobacter quercicolus]